MSDLMSDSEWGEWIEWAGGACPVAPGEPVQLRFLGGAEFAVQLPQNWQWCRLGIESDIVAYRTKRQTIALPAKDMAGDKHSHYFKDVSKLDRLDVYRLLALFEVSDPALQHIIKKALCAGKRGAKDFAKDVREIADTANRRVEMLREDGNV